MRKYVQRPQHNLKHRLRKYAWYPGDLYLEGERYKSGHTATLNAAQGVVEKLPLQFEMYKY
ncbi:unnamed protein product [Ceratitis capitata]|uniref:(Mediterranean fruit fly) hypothetical protein n=1 Tax=Ceratitis capitata TaxID=7213 RepID=A0A811UVF7_CERCA|nr:unnamed protein product [Ceratitis capitata]